MRLQLSNKHIGGMLKMSNIGYIINESGILMESIDIIEPKDSVKLSGKLDLKFHNRDRLIGYGVLQTADEQNRNGRIYKAADLAKELKAPRQIELMRVGQFCGEAGHPIGEAAKSLARQQTIEPKCTCVRHHKVWMEGNKVLGYFEGTNNPLGETFDKDLRTGIKPAFSLRALGVVKSTPQGAVVDKLKIITYDYVIFPSHKGAYTIGVVNESAGVSSQPTSGFNFTSGLDATKSYIKEFTNQDALTAISRNCVKESAVEYVKDNSFNFKMLQEYFDMGNFDTVDILNGRQLILTEANKQTIVMNIEDYIAKEIQSYL